MNTAVMITTIICLTTAIICLTIVAICIIGRGMNKTKKLIEESILFAISSISKDIQGSVDEKDNSVRAISINVLCNAYNTIHRGKGRKNNE